MESQEIPFTATVHDPYYQEEFRKIYDTKEAYKGKWNWWAFFFTGIWAIIKGCWVLFLIIFLTSSLIKFRFPLGDYLYLSFGLSGLFWSLLMGWRGTWFYYTLKVKKKQPPF
ncbi:MAG TPA: hypothetical protein VMZ69_00060 [Saprospiraceae bacterium]|nr:hypothetical protein [Saprospiraceae bacterium]